jgi:3-hydroxy-9,10-secoandrosta-1,3,5(10)-triene-9,17-dione monooxygenase
VSTTDSSQAEPASAITDELRRRAAEIAPELAARARDFDDARRVPEDVVDQLVRAGLTDVVNPWRYGGEGAYDAALAATYELGRGSGSVAWCHAVWTQHNWMLGMWPEEMQAEYFAGPGTICASAFNPAGATAERVDGGFRLSGQWSFSSGCDNAKWAMLTAFVREREVGFLILPREDWEIVDTWFVSGLKGTGSKDIRVESAFVPEHRVVTQTHLAEPKSAFDRPDHALPAWPMTGLSLTYAVLGMARGALDAFEGRLRAGATSIAGNRPMDQPTTHLRLSEAAVELDAAEGLCDRSVADMLDHARRGDPPTIADRVRYARDRTYAIRLGLQAVNRLFDASGAGGLYEQAAIQRFHRDAHAGSHHPFHLWDTYALHYGRDRLGLEIGPARLL